MNPQQIQSMTHRARTFKWVSIVFAALAALVAAMWLIKVMQTSEFMLRYDEQTQVELGLLTLGIMVAGFLALMAAVLSIGSGRRAKNARSQLIEQLRSDLQRAQSDTERLSIESRLRELGA